MATAIHKLAAVPNSAITIKPSPFMIGTVPLMDVSIKINDITQLEGGIDTFRSAMNDLFGSSGWYACFETAVSPFPIVANPMSRATVMKTPKADR